MRLGLITKGAPLGLLPNCGSEKSLKSLCVMFSSIIGVSVVGFLYFVTDHFHIAFLLTPQQNIAGWAENQLGSSLNLTRKS